MKILVGTSGWVYSWNPDGLDWYIENSGLKTVELNMSFYRYPFKNQILGWVKRSKKCGLRWSIKVHRIISHRYLLSEKTYEYFKRFLDLFKPLDKYIDFYLIQLPPRFRNRKENVDRLKEFTSYFNLGWRLAVEFRHKSWFNNETVNLANKYGFTYVSVDSPETIFYGRSGPYIYVRFHGRTFWYAHYYTDDELTYSARKLLNLGGKAIYAYFNNNHDMLDNARRFRDILLQLLHGN